MKLTSLKIDLAPSWDDNAGKYVAVIQYEADKQSVTLVLDPEISTRILAFVGPVITFSALKASRQLEANIKLSLEEANKLPALELAPE